VREHYLKSDFINNYQRTRDGTHSKADEGNPALGKVRVVERSEQVHKTSLGGSTTMTIMLTHMHLYDIKDGDLLSIYTEVLLAQPNN